MSAGDPSSPSLRPSLLCQFDYLSGWLGMALGGGLALAAPPRVASAGFLALLYLAVALARSGEPITVVGSLPQ
jgi:hypothetical protein